MAQEKLRVTVGAFLQGKVLERLVAFSGVQAPACMPLFGIDGVHSDVITAAAATAVLRGMCCSSAVLWAVQGDVAALPSGHVRYRMDLYATGFMAQGVPDDEKCLVAPFSSE